MTQTALPEYVKIKDMPFQIIDGDRGANYPKGHELTDSGFCLFLSAKNVTKGGFDFTQNQFISSEKDIRLRKGKLQRRDLTLTTRGTVGNVAMYDKSVQYDNIRINSGMVIIRCDESKLSPEYLYFVLRSNIFQDQVENFRSGSAQPQLPIRDMQNMKLPLPDLETQKKIADILGTIDEKIELNRRMNEMLEQMGQALFRHYFIDNPEAERWERVPISELCEKVASGGTPATKREDYYGGDVQWYSTKELKDGFLFGSEKTITEEGLGNSAAKLFPAQTVMMAIYAAPTVGRLGVLTSKASFNQATCGLVAKEEVGYEFIYLYLLLSRTELNNMANGAAQQNINVGKVRDFKVMSPNEATLSEFRKEIAPIFTTIKNNSEHIQTLTILRDTLLPRLINGKVKV